MTPRSTSKLSVTIPPRPLPSSFSSSEPTDSTPSPTKSTSQPSISFSQLEHLNQISSGSTNGYKVLHTPTNHLYTLCIFNIKNDDSLNQIRQACLRDLELLRRIHHPNLVNCHGFVNHGEIFKVLFDHVDSISLKGSRIQNEVQLANITFQVLSALAYLHTQKLVHRDLKPSNLLVNSQNEVKVSEFGLSIIFRHSRDILHPSDIAYMSPERINTDLYTGPYDGFAGDVWSLGLSILQVYLGTYPFDIVQEGGWASLMNAICGTHSPQVPPRAKREFRDFVACCLQKDPTKRWTAAQLLLHPFVVQNVEDCKQKAQVV